MWLNIVRLVSWLRRGIRLRGTLFRLLVWLSIIRLRLGICWNTILSSFDFLKTLMVGKPYTFTSSNSLATESILATTTLQYNCYSQNQFNSIQTYVSESAYFSPSLSQVGISSLQWPNHRAYNSTKTSFSVFMATSSKFLLTKTQTGSLFTSPSKLRPSLKFLKRAMMPEASNLYSSRAAV